MDFLFKKIILALRDLRESIDASRDQQERHHQQQQTERELPKPPIRVEAETHEREDPSGKQKPTSKRQLTVQWVIGAGTWATFAAAAIYAGLTWGMWKTAQQSLSDSQTSAEKQLTKIGQQIDKLKEANDIAIAANRPWVATINPSKGLEVDPRTDQLGRPYVQFAYVWTFKNAGHRPARMESLRNTAETYSDTCGMDPNFNKRFPGAMQLGLGSAKKPTKAILLPDSTAEAPFAAPIDAPDWPKVLRGDLLWCMYVKIEYRDVQFPEIVHHTRDCRVYYPAFRTVGNCNNEYSAAD